MRTIYILKIVVVLFLFGFKDEIQGLDWPWNWKLKDITCYSTCLAVVSVPLAFAGIGDTGMASRLCGAFCGKSERQDLKCYTKKLEGMKGLDEHVLKAEPTKSFMDCERMCNDMITCKAFRFIPKNNLCFLYSNNQYYTADDIESEFYTHRCILCYMNSTKDAKGPDNEIDSVSEISSFVECAKKCIKSDDCKAVHFHRSRCFKFNKKVTPMKIAGIEFSNKICVEINDIALDYEDKKD